MLLRRHAAALAASCALLSAAPLFAQASRTNVVPIPAQVRIVRTNAPVRPVRLEPVAEWQAEDPMPGGMIQSWAVDRDVEFGLGRFRVSEARRRTNLENERNPARMEQPTRAIAGAGLRIRFR